MRWRAWPIFVCGIGVSGACGGDDSTSGATLADAGVEAEAPHDATVEVDAPFDAESPADVSDAAPPEGPNVLQHHKHANRDGVFIDDAFTKDAIRRTARDSGFVAVVEGAVYAQPLFLEAGLGGKDVLFVATERNHIYALSATTGAVIWDRVLGTPVPLSALPCGGIDPLGVTGTPVIDLASRTIFLDAMIGTVAVDGGTDIKHLVFGLSIDDGTTRPGWPVDLGSALSDFDSSIHNQRGALALFGGSVFIPFGGLAGDCLSYHGRVVGVSLTNPTTVHQWEGASIKAGIWAPGGVTSDGTSLFVTTGNGYGPGTDWLSGEAVIRLSALPAFSGQPADYFTPSNWLTLDQLDLDMSGVAPFPVDLPGATPSRLVLALGKNGIAYVLSRDNLGGIGKGDGGSGEGLSSVVVADGPIIGAPALAQSGGRTFIVFKGYIGSGATGGEVLGIGCPSGQSGGLVGAELVAGAPPSVHVAWCRQLHGAGGQMITTPNGSSDTAVWTVEAEYSNRLMAYDIENGDILFDSSVDAQALGEIRRFIPPIAAKGRVFIAGDNAVYAFLVK